MTLTAIDKQLLRIWWREGRSTILFAALVLLVGFSIGQLLASSFLLVLGLLVKHLVQAYSVSRWLLDNSTQDPPTHGVWHPIIANIEARDSDYLAHSASLRSVINDAEQTLEATPDAVVTMREQGEIAWINQGATALLGLRAQDIGHPIANLVRQPEFTRYIDAPDQDEPLTMASPVNEAIQLSIRVVAYGDNRCLLIARDVTRLHRLEQMRQDFVANVSHELRSPLTVLIGYLEGMNDDETLTQEWQRPVEQMSQQAERMRSVVEDLLRLSSLENDPGGALKQPVQVASMLEGLRADALNMGRARHSIVLDAEPDTVVLGEHNELFSSFSNLIYNAVQYTPDDGTITIRWYTDTDGGFLEVEDTGIGIPAHHLARLTERFYRVDKARSRAVGGTGLGLAIVKHVLMRHDAALSVRSTPGKGSKFICHFPPFRIAGRADTQAIVAGSDAMPTQSQEATRELHSDELDNPSADKETKA